MKALRFVRRWGWEFASLAVVLAGIAAYLLIGALNPTGLTPGERVQLLDGRVSFTMPRGWDRPACDSGTMIDCVEVSPPHAGAGDFISASLLIDPVSIGGDSPLAFLFSPELPAGAQRITIDGVAAARLDDADGDEKAVAVVALLPSKDVFTLICEYDQREREIREACDMIIGTLSLRQ